MTNPSHEADSALGERRHLLSLAYRLLGSAADAEDIVQAAYARYYALSTDQHADIISPGAWLSTVTSRLCLDHLKSARVRRELYVGEWIPEPVPNRGDWASAATPADPSDRVSLDESVTMAFLVVLDTMTAAERVAFVLHDVHRYPFNDIADILGRSAAACRQLATSARRRIEDAERPQAPAPDQARVVRQLRRAWEEQDISALLRLLAPEVSVVADGGGRVSAARHPIEGSDRVARFLVGLKRTVAGLSVQEQIVNGRPGLVARLDGQIDTVFAVQVDGAQVTRVWATRNPDKLGLCLDD